MTTLIPPCSVTFKQYDLSIFIIKFGYNCANGPKLVLKDLCENISTSHLLQLYNGHRLHCAPVYKRFYVQKFAYLAGQRKKKRQTRRARGFLRCAWAQVHFRVDIVVRRQLAKKRFSLNILSRSRQHSLKSSSCHPD